MDVTCLEFGAKWVGFWGHLKAELGGCLGACGRVANSHRKSLKIYEMEIATAPERTRKAVRFFVLAAK
jgi:hypothetical protein